MATDHKYPLTTSDELKKQLSQIDIDFDIENINSSIKLAANDLKDIISEDVWKQMIDHYNDTANYNQSGQQNAIYILLDKLVFNTQAALANFTFYHHFIWLQLRISNDSVTVTKSENETAAYRYQTDEAKEKLIDTAWVDVNTLINFLNKNTLHWTDWVKKTAYKTDDVVRHAENYYKAKSDFTSGDSFDSGNWTALSPTAVALIFNAWIQSDQYSDLQYLVFDDYKDFDKCFGIDRSASFFIKARYVIQEITDEDILPRTGAIDKITDAILKKKIKRAVAYKTMAVALVRFDFFFLPAAIRKRINNEMISSTRFRDIDYAKQKISALLENKADQYFQNIDFYVASLEEVAVGESPFEKFEHTTDPDDKHVALI